MQVNCHASSSSPACVVYLQYVADQIIPGLVQGIKGTMADPESASAQLALIKAAQDMNQPGNKLIGTAKGATPTVSDQATALSLENAAKNMAIALQVKTDSCLSKRFMIHMQRIRLQKLSK